jgi:hypothetical protein
MALHHDYLDRPTRTLDQALRDRGIVRIECRDRQGQRTGVDRTYLTLACNEMYDLLDEALAENRPGWPKASDVQVTARLSARQWSRALCIPEFCAADYLPAERIPEGVERSRTRSWLGIDWLRDADLPGAQTRHCTCTLKARAADRDFTVELVVDDLVGIPA